MLQLNPGPARVEETTSQATASRIFRELRDGDRPRADRLKFKSDAEPLLTRAVQLQ